MFSDVELYTINQTLIFCFLPRAETDFFFSSQKPLTNIVNVQNQGYLRIYQLKTEAQTMVYQNT